VSAADLDRDVLLLARTRGHASAADRLISAFSRSGEHGACWVALGAVGALTERDGARQRLWLQGIGVVVAAYGLNYAVKLAVRRSRPKLDGLPPLTPTVSRLSFPSAHATTSFAAARAFSRVAPAAPLYAAAIAFGLSRPYLGVHYPSDVAAGALLGTALAAVWPDCRTVHQ
jgi:membrane-associated phospholipid phosphatase